jgi:hypothetical protein
LGTASAGAGLIVARYYDTAFAYLQNHGEPLLQAPRSVNQTLFAYGTSGWDGSDQWRLSLGDWFKARQYFTWREVFERYNTDQQDYFSEYQSLAEMADEWGFASEDALLDSDAYFEHFENDWYANDCPFTQAYDLLDCDEIGPVLRHGDAIGHLFFEYAPGMCSVPGGIVDAADLLTLSLLQHRLNELGKGIAIKLDT